MLYVFRLFIKRIAREGFKSLSVPALALVLVVLINIIGGIRQRQAVELESVFDNFEVRVEVSDPVGDRPEALYISYRYIALFTDKTNNVTLAGFLKDVELKRDFFIYDASDTNGFPDHSPIGILTGISSVKADEHLYSLSGAYIDFFEGYDESVFASRDHVCIVNEETFNTLDPDMPVLSVTLKSSEENEYVTARLRVIGIVYGTGNVFYSPFWTVSELVSGSNTEYIYTEILNALISDNRYIDEFKAEARNHFVASGVIDKNKPFTLTVFDGSFNDIVNNLHQNIRLIDIATPFIYFLSVCIGFVASFLLTRRRKHEFAMLRSIGIHKKDLFFGILSEQAVLCLTGALAGFALTFIILGDVIPIPFIIFTACYITGAALSAMYAVGTDILVLLTKNE